MSYAPKSPQTLTTVEDLKMWVEDELQMISQEFEAELRLVNLRPVFRDVDKPRDGMLVYADGVSFNPGAGAGTYERKAGVWVKL